MTNLIEQIADFHHQGKDVIIVSSGSVGLGKSILTPPASTECPDNEISNRAYASCGQSKLMANYDFLFSQYSISIAQVLSAITISPMG